MPQFFDIVRADAPLGAEVRGLRLTDDPSVDCGEELGAELRKALAEHLVLFVRGQQLSPARHAAFAALFGVPEAHGFVAGLDGHDAITEIRKEPEHSHNFGGAWHFDLSFRPSPPLAAVLVAREIPASGGDTLWANQYLAYEALSPELKAEIDRLDAVHSSQLAFGGFRDAAAAVTTTHPLAPVHHLTGRRHLFANPVSSEQVVGRTLAESRDLLDALVAHATAEAFHYRHRWQVGDVLVWDNRASMHRALNDYAGQRRVMHRISVSDPKARP